MVPAGNKAKRLSWVNHTTKTIHHNHRHLHYRHHLRIFGLKFAKCIVMYEIIKPKSSERKFSCKNENP